MLTNLALFLGLLLTALPGVFPLHLGAIFLPALPTPLPPLSADAPAPAQGLQKERRRAGSTGSGVLPNLTRAWDGTRHEAQNSNLKLLACILAHISTADKALRRRRGIER